MKMKKPPSMRRKKHYVVFRLLSDEPVDFYEVKNAVWNGFFNWLGEEGVSKAYIKIFKNLWNPKTQTGFVSCVPKYVNSVKLALSLVHQIGDQRVIFQVIRVSGTIKSAKKIIK
ncbi:MAG: hypothetical protein DRP16_02335 [Candidatus Aenigmatarchaeota archaeon]|nr:MAG: hypothetical protein DRP16_02335 [Candidatus Aenigmarchaeota archaeon]